MLRSGRDRYEHLWAARSLRSHRRRGRRAQDGIGADTPFEGLIFPLQRCLPAMAIGCPKAAAVAECHVRCAAARTQAIWAAGFERHVAEVNSCCEKAGANSKECDNARRTAFSHHPPCRLPPREGAVLAGRADYFSWQALRARRKNARAQRMWDYSAQARHDSHAVTDAKAASHYVAWPAFAARASVHDRADAWQARARLPFPVRAVGTVPRNAAVEARRRPHHREPAASIGCGTPGRVNVHGPAAAPRAR